MKKCFKNLFAFVLAACMLACMSLTTFAVEPTYEVSEGYKAGGYYDRLLAYELTDDNRYDVMSIALSQLGYHEGDSEEDFDGLNVDGDRNFVEYNRLHGKVDNNEGNGVSYGYAWCAAFVSWCLRQARLSYTAATNSISCGGMMDWYRRNDRLHMSGDGYTPIAGDIIFFSNETAPSHVGLVLGVLDGKVYTVEGNNGGNVAIHSYDLTSDYVISYCVPKYNESTHDLEALMMENINKTGEFVVNAKSLNVRSAPNNESEVLGVLEKNTTVNVTALEGSWGKIDFDGKEGWVYMPHTTDADLKVYTVKYELSGGEGVKPQRKLKGNSLTITKDVPTRKGYDFVGWTNDKDVKVPSHKAGDVYSADEDLTLYAIWEPALYDVFFFDEDGTVLYHEECEFNDFVPKPEEPTKPSDSEYRYKFAGWSPKPVDVVVKDLSYVATYTAIPLGEEDSAVAESEEKGEENSNDSTADEAKVSNKRNNDGPSVGLYIIICAAAVAIIGAGCFIIKKRK